MASTHLTIRHTEHPRPGIAAGSLVVFVCSLAVFAGPLASLAALGWRDERYAYLLIAPAISALLLYFRKETLAAHRRPAPVLGTSLAALGLTLSLTAVPPSSTTPESLAISATCLVLMWIGAFAVYYGHRALRIASVPLMFAALLIPLPENVMQAAVLALQRGSADAAYLLFKLVSVPLTREQFVFSLPGIQIEIAKECSSIRSSVFLLLTSLAIGDVLLLSRWRRTALALLTIVLAIVKNAVRIVTVSWLGLYIDHSYFYGKLHHYGGPLFLMGALLFLGVLLSLLQRPERGHEPTKRPAHGA